MSDLTQQQLDFLRKHLNYDSAGYLRKKKLKSQLQDFWRRRDKAQAELDILPPDHARRKAFEGDIAKATKTAEGGKLKEAYEALDAVKLAARAEADLIRNGLSVNTIAADLAALKTKTSTVAQFHNTQIHAFDQRANTLEFYAKMTPVVADGADRNDMIDRAGRLAAAKKELLERLDALDGAAVTASGQYMALFTAAPATGPTVDRLNHNAGLLRNEGKLNPAIEGTLLFINQHIGDCKMDGSGADFLKTIQARLTRCRNAMHATFDAHKQMPRLEPAAATDMHGNAMTQDEARTADYAWSQDDRTVEDVFAKFERENEERVQRAREAMKAEDNYDILVLRRTTEVSPLAPSRVAAFDMGTIISDDFFSYDPFADDREAELIQDCSAYLEVELQQMSKAYVGSGKKVPDELLEITSRTRDAWLKDVATKLGEVWNPDTLDPKKKARIEKLADALRAKALEEYPDRANEDMTKFTMGGEVFDDIKKLGQGGGGTVFLATSKSGRQVVIKQPNDMGTAALYPEKHEEFVEDMRTEIMAHRAVTGGEDGVCHTNLLEHQGMVMGPEGIPFPVMDLADAGDADVYDTALLSATDSGLLSEAARQAMMAAQLRDMLKGVKAMHDQGFAHFDLKELNVFMMADGTFKVADFGLAQEADTRDDTLEGRFETTPIYKAPEIDGSEDLTQKGDMFSLGAILRRMVDPLRSSGKAGEKWAFDQAGPGATVDDKGDAVAVSASSRLISKLMSENPDERPSLEAALESSYIDGLERDFSPEALDQLRKATAEFAATVGRQTKDLDAKVAKFKSDIALKERALSGQDIQDLIVENERFVKQKTDQKLGLDREIARTQDPEEIEKLTRLRDFAERDIKAGNGRLTEYRKKLGDRPKGADRRAIEDEIAALRTKLGETRAKIAEIRDRPEHAAVIRKLEEANALFR